jgi:hypothetical protein
MDELIDICLGGIAICTMLAIFFIFSSGAL